MGEHARITNWTLTAPNSACSGGPDVSHGRRKLSLRQERRRIMNIKRIATTLLIVLIICTARVVQGKTKSAHSSEQTHFSAEDLNVERPVSIPDSVLAILKKDEGVRDILESEGIPSAKIPLSWFSASTIHLDGREEKDLVVMGVASLRGSNVTTFWVFRRGTGNDYKLVLTEVAHDLEVKNMRAKGYRDIELLSATAAQVSTVLYRFNGKEYTEYKAKNERIP
jgi:hypothetical protein